ncbi:VOC family protein [Nocardia sp. NBC_01327]|uniref:VOC family protein n=1 Tax=Nocardia sp. NBC_01327 TaxID=2903593 RepID=UPI002E13E8B0|nr:VOC family protein [Nocardia sp. NBC_01327]
MSELDHLVLATPDLGGTVERIARLLGVEPVAGGRHTGRGTRNFLLGLGNGGYLEIIGPDTEQPEPAQPRPFGIDRLTESRLAGWLVRVTDIDAAVAAARAVGYDPGDPQALSRETPDGRVLHWRLTFPDFSEPTQLVPALIDWGATDHPSDELPTVPLRSLEAVHPNPAAVSEHLKALDAHLIVRQGNRPALIATIGDGADPTILL